VINYEGAALLPLNKLPSLIVQRESLHFLALWSSYPILILSSEGFIPIVAKIIVAMHLIVQ
jgi:hypothetical protein